MKRHTDLIPNSSSRRLVLTTAVHLAVAVSAIGCTDKSSSKDGNGIGDAIDTEGFDADAGSADAGANDAEGDQGTDGDAGTRLDLLSEGGNDDSASPNPPGPFHDHPNLWYSVGELLVYIELDPADGTVSNLVAHEIENVPSFDAGSTESALTMLDDGVLLGAKLHSGAGRTEVYRIAMPPVGDTPQTLTPEYLGDMPDGIVVEGLYTGCENRLYAMDTGVNVSSSEGNRLLEFTADVMGGDLAYAVVSDLSTADVADIDDMAPGIDENGEIRDTPGLAIDSGTVHEFDYVIGTGSETAKAGNWGIHTISGELFDDGQTRVYVLDRDARLYELDPQTGTVGPELVQGPKNTTGPSDRGNGGLTGPAPSCVSSFPPVG